MKRKLSIMLVVMMTMAVLLTGAAMAVNYDLGGKTVSFIDDGLAMYGPEGEYAGRTEEVEEKFNANIETMSTINSSTWNDPSSKIARLMSGDSTYDIWLVNNWMYFPILEMGGMYPLDDAISEVLGPDPYADYIEPVKQKRRMLEHAGVNYAMFANSGGGQHFALFNKDIIEDQGLPDPYELYRNGEWNWTNMMEIAEAATKDLDGDGEIDQWGLMMRMWHATLMNQAEVIKYEDGKYSFDPDHAWAEALTLTQEMHGSGVYKGDWSGKTFLKGQILFINQAAWRLTNELTEDSEFRYGVVPMPKMPSAESYVSINAGFSAHVLPVNTAQPEALVALFHDLKRIGDIDVVIKNRQLTYAQDPLAAEVIEDAVRKFPVQYRYFGFPFMSKFVNHVENVFWGSGSAAEKIAEIKPAAQQKVDEMLNFDSAFSN